MKIYDVIFVIYLEFITNFILNLYKRWLLSSLFIILNDENEIKRLIRKRNRYIEYSKNKIMKYFVR